MSAENVSNVDRFEAMVYQQDETEAWLIHEKYLPNAGIKDALQSAINEVERDLRQDYPGPQDIDFETVKKAKRWWNYRGAFLKDIKQVYEQLDNDSEGDPWQHGLEPEFVSYADKFESEQSLQKEMGRYIVDGDPYYLQLFSTLFAYKRHLEERGAFLLNPMDAEENFALRGLLNVLDDRLSQDDAVMIDTTTICEGKTPGIAGQHYSLRRNVGTEATQYEIGFYSIDGSKDIIDTLVHERKPEVVFNVKDGPQGVAYKGESWYGPAVLSLFTMADLSRLISSDKDFSFVKSEGEFKY